NAAGGTTPSAKRPFSQRAARKPALLSGKKRPSSGTLAARNYSYRAQNGAVLLPTASNQGHERRLGQLLALHFAVRSVRQQTGERRVHAGVPAQPQPSSLSTTVRLTLLFRH